MPNGSLAKAKIQEILDSAFDENFLKLFLKAYETLFELENEQKKLNYTLRHQSFVELLLIYKDYKPQTRYAEIKTSQAEASEIKTSQLTLKPISRKQETLIQDEHNQLKLKQSGLSP